MASKTQKIEVKTPWIFATERVLYRNEAKPVNGKCFNS